MLPAPSVRRTVILLVPTTKPVPARYLLASNTQTPLASAVTVPKIVDPARSTVTVAPASVLPVNVAWV